MIRDRKKYADAAPCWGIFDSVLGSCRLSDIDGICEKNGRFLVIESKPSIGALRRGQEILLDRLSRIDGFTVIAVVGHDTDMPVIRKFPGHEWRETTRELYIEAVRRWFQSASR